MLDDGQLRIFIRRELVVIQIALVLGPRSVCIVLLTIHQESTRSSRDWHGIYLKGDVPCNGASLFFATAFCIPGTLQGERLTSFKPGSLRLTVSTVNQHAFTDPNGILEPVSKTSN